MQLARINGLTLFKIIVPSSRDVQTFPETLVGQEVALLTIQRHGVSKNPNGILEIVRISRAHRGGTSRRSHGAAVGHTHNGSNADI